MTLALRCIVSNQDGVRSFKDERRRVTRVVASYFGEDGHEYRKSFESYGTPEVPERGTHKALNALEIQWRAEPCQ